MRNLCLGLAAIALIGCGEEDPVEPRKPGVERDASAPRDPGDTPRERADASTDVSGESVHDASAEPARDAAQAPPGEPSVPPTGEVPPASAAGLPCDVQAVLEARCTQCHSAGTPQFGAPMALASHADLQAESPRGKAPYFEVAKDRINKTGTGQMPPAGQPPLSEQERATLQAFLEAGAPRSEQACTPSTPQPGGQPSPNEPPTDTGTDCDVEFELRAHEDDGSPFKVPMVDDRYECFYFKANVSAETLATALTPLLDETQVLHHWLLFAADNEDESPSGTHRECSGVHPGAYLMAAWLPGTPALVLPQDVGMEMPQGESAQWILENHYNNIARIPNLEDNSGVHVCATNKPKPTHAAMHWLGSELVNIPPRAKGTAQGTCTLPQQGEPVTVMGIIPHLHKLGRHVKMTILRKDGTEEVLHDAPFEFESQGYFEKNVVLQPGDRVHTKCDYENTGNTLATYGERTSNEMCYMFTLAYPVGVMNTGGDLLIPFTNTPLIQGPNRCLR